MWRYSPTLQSGYGKRACRVAIGSVYGRDVAICGPVYKSHKTEGSTLRVAFDNTGQGLAFKHADKIVGFEIAGKDGKWQWAEARIDGKTVVLSHPEIAKRSPSGNRYFSKQIIIHESFKIKSATMTLAVDMNFQLVVNDQALGKSRFLADTRKYPVTIDLAKVLNTTAQCSNIIAFLILISLLKLQKKLNMAHLAL